MIGNPRIVHILIINDECITTTRNKEVLKFARPRIASKFDWKHLKDAVRLGESLTIAGGQ